MNSSSPRNATALSFLRLLLPSSASLIVCISGATVMIAIHLLFVTVNQGTLFPELFDGQWGIAYTNNIVGPINSLFGNDIVATVCMALLWSLAGVIVYEIISRAVYAFIEWRQVESEVQVVEGRLVRHPLRRSFITRSLWHLAVGGGAITLFLLARPIFRHLLQVDSQVINATAPALSNLGTIVGVIAAWSLCAHCALVLARLYVLRARLFG